MTIVYYCLAVFKRGRGIKPIQWPQPSEQFENQIYFIILVLSRTRNNKLTQNNSKQ